MSEKAYNPYTKNFQQDDTGLILTTSDILQHNISENIEAFMNHCNYMHMLRKDNFLSFKISACQLQYILSLDEAKIFYRVFYSENAYKNDRLRPFIFLNSSAEYRYLISSIKKVSQSLIYSMAS